MKPSIGAGKVLRDNKNGVATGERWTGPTCRDSDQIAPKKAKVNQDCFGGSFSAPLSVLAICHEVQRTGRSNFLPLTTIGSESTCGPPRGPLLEWRIGHRMRLSQVTQ